MSRFEIHPDNLTREPFRMYNTGSDIRHTADRVLQVKGDLDNFELSGIEDIKNSLEVLYQTLNKDGNRVCDCADGLNMILREYNRAENDVLRHNGAGIFPLFTGINWYAVYKALGIHDGLYSLLHNYIPAAAVIGAASTLGPIGLLPLLLHGLSLSDEEKAGFDLTFKGELKDFKDENGDSIFGWAKKADDWAKDKTASHRKEPGFTMVRDKNGNWKKVPYSDDKESQAYKDSKDAKDLAKNPIPVDVKLADKKFVEEDKALWGSTPDIKVKNGIFEGSDAGVQLGRWKADADAYIGPGSLGVSAGTSITLLHAYADGKIGNDYLNAHGNVTVDVGRAGIEGGLEAGLFDKNGNVNPSLYAEGKAEIIAAEASAEAGVNVLGVDASVKGSVNVGIGAHVNAGIHDGKIAVDIGASLGVGASVQFTIDAGGAVNAICEGAKSVFDGVTGFFGGLF